MLPDSEEFDLAHDFGPVSESFDVVGIAIWDSPDAKVAMAVASFEQRYHLAAGDGLSVKIRVTRDFLYRRPIPIGV
jgi:hypothetical protein